MSIENPGRVDVAKLAEAEEKAGVVDQQSVASALAAGGAAEQLEDDMASDPDADTAIELPLEEGDFDSQP